MSPRPPASHRPRLPSQAPPPPPAQGKGFRALSAGKGSCPLPAGRRREGQRLLPNRRLYPPLPGLPQPRRHPLGAAPLPPAAPARPGPLTVPLAARPAPGPHHGRGCRSRSCSSRSGSHPLRRSTRRCWQSCRPPPSPPGDTPPPPPSRLALPRRPPQDGTLPAAPGLPETAAAIFATGSAHRKRPSRHLYPGKLPHL